MAKKPKQKIIIGSKDRLDLPEFELIDIPCKVDTGAYTSTMHCSQVRLLEKDGYTLLCVRLYDSKFGISNKKEYRFKEFSERKVRSSNGHLEYRFSIVTTVVMFGKKYNTEFTLSSREKMRNPILLGRKFLRTRFLVDVSKKDLSYQLKNSK